MERKLLTPEEQIVLLRLARQKLSAYLNDQAFNPSPEQFPASFQPKCSCFVTYHCHGSLRGCVGSIYPELPLYEEVLHNAVSAACDSRFDPIDKIELEHLRVEISVLSPIRQIASLDEFELGKHGIIVSLHGRRAVYLPQVAVEQGWDKKTTLQHLCQKAGLASNSWKQKEACFFIFTTQICEEV